MAGIAEIESGINTQIANLKAKLRGIGKATGPETQATVAAIQAEIDDLNQQLKLVSTSRTMGGKTADLSSINKLRGR